MGLRAHASAPGKVILHGEHAVVYGQPALACSLGLRTAVTVQEEPSCDSPVIRLSLPDVQLEHSVPAARFAESVAGAAGAPDAWSRPQLVAHERLLGAVDGFLAPRAQPAGAARDAVRALLYLLGGVLDAAQLARGLALRARGALAVGAGAGSSAALGVGAAAALLRFREAGGRARALDERDKRLVSAWAYNCERIVHGAPSGVDNATCTWGGLVAFCRGAEPRALPLALRLRVLLVDSRVSRRTSALGARVAARRARDADAVQCALQACGHVTRSATRILEQLSNCEGDADELYRHLAELWDMNHCLLAALGASHPALEHIRQLAAAHQLPAKLTGAGGGGYALVLVPPAAPEPEVRALGAALRAAGYGVLDTLLGGEGVRLHEPEDDADALA